MGKIIVRVLEAYIRKESDQGMTEDLKEESYVEIKL